ncbi:MAG TPA: hypothetical protein VFT47_10235 [Vicinamibacterales bacterium]|nr:hypothetical protein [Vicinamibacterales bacterium]
MKSRSGERRSTKEKRGHITAEAVRQAQGRDEKSRVAREILSSCAGVLTSAPHLQRPGSRRVVGDGPTSPMRSAIGSLDSSIAVSPALSCVKLSTLR